MITPEQRAWLDHLSDTDVVRVVPWDPTAEGKFAAIRDQARALLGQQRAVEHRGATSLGISGQDEIDIYIPVPTAQFDHVVTAVMTLYGDPRSLYPLKRARFVTSIHGKHIDVFVINEDDQGWKDSCTFHQYLLDNPPTLTEYRVLKEQAAGTSTRAYYERKTEFINKVLSAASGDRSTLSH